MSKKSNNPLDHVRVKQRGASWAYYFEKAKVDGKRRRGEGGGYATEQDARMAGVEAYNAYIGGGAKKNDASISFADYLDIWYERTRLYARNNTLELREKNIRLHIKPALGEYRLSSLSPAIIDQFVQQKRKDGYAYETVARILSNISTALDYAIYPMELLRENPARLIKVPSKEFAPLSHRQPRRRIEDNELAMIFQRHPFGTTFHMPLVIGLYFGTRIGEALCLSWDNCDMQRMTIAITQQIQRLAMRGKVGLHYVCDLKTDSSHRTLSFDAQVILPLLQHWKRQQAKNELYYGEDYFYNYIVPAKDYQGRDIRKIVSLEKGYPAPGPRIEIICTQPNGKYIKPTTLGYQCKRIRELGVHDFDFHCMRHTNLTMLGESQAAPNDIMARAGHSDYDTTLRYIENRPEMQEVPVQIISGKAKNVL